MAWLSRKPRAQQRAARRAPSIDRPARIERDRLASARPGRPAGAAISRKVTGEPLVLAGRQQIGRRRAAAGDQRRRQQQDRLGVGGKRLASFVVSRMARAPSDRPRRSRCERSSHAATVSVQRESTMSSTRRTGPGRKCGWPMSASEPSMLRACWRCLPSSSARAGRLFSANDHMKRQTQRRSQASREVRNQVGMAQRGNAGHPGRGGLRIPLADHLTHAPTRSSAKWPSSVLALPDQAAPASIAPDAERLAGLRLMFQARSAP